MRFWVLVATFVISNSLTWYYLMSTEHKIDYKNGIILPVNSAFFAQLTEGDEPLVYIQGVLIFNESRYGSRPYVSLVQDEEWAARRVAGFVTTRLYIDVPVSDVLPDCIGRRVILHARYRLPRYQPELSDVRSIQSVSELSSQSHSCFSGNGNKQ
jgi:hypothetical protein